MWRDDGRGVCGDGIGGSAWDGGGSTSGFASDDGAADSEEGGGAEGGNSQRLKIDRDSRETEQFVQLELCTRVGKDLLRRGCVSLQSIRTPVFKVRFNSFCETILD
jgi:hypothetical protein